MSLPTVEEVQTAILQALGASADGKIDDTRTLAVNGQALGENGQPVVKAALDSLESKNVSAPPPAPNRCSLCLRRLH